MRKRFLATLLALAMVLSVTPFALAEDGGEASAPTASGNNFFANGTSITITAEKPDNGEQATFAGFTATGTDAYISWTEDDATKYVGVSGSAASIFGGSDGRESAVSVPSTSIAMTGGTIWNLFGGNYGEEAAETDFCSTVEGNINISLSGTAVVKNLLHGAGARNTCVNGTITMTFDDVDLSSETNKLYVNGGSWGNGNEGTRKIESGAMDTDAVANKVVINANNSKFYLLGGGGSGSTKVKEAIVTLNGCTVANLYASGINGEMEKSSLKATDCTVTGELAATNRGFIKTADVTLKDCKISLLMTGATTGCFETDSGKPDGSGITGSIVWKIDEQTEVTTARLTPLAKRDTNDQTTATLDNITIEKSGDPLEISVDEFKPHSKTSVNTFLVSETGTLALNNVKATVTSGQTLTNAGTIDMDDASKLTVASGATLGQAGTVTGTGEVVNSGGTVTEYVARVGNTGHMSLEDALDAVKSSGGTITLLKDATLEADITISKNITIDGQGKYKIDAQPEKSHAITVDHSGALTLENVALNITNGDVETGSYGLDVQYGATLTLDNADVTLAGLSNATISGNPNSAGTEPGKFVLTKGSTITANNIGGNFSNGGTWTVGTGSKVTIDGCDSHGFSASAITVENGATVDIRNIAYRGISINDANGKLEIQSGGVVNVTNAGTADNDTTARDAVYLSANATNGLQVAEGGTLNVTKGEKGNDRIILDANAISNSHLNGTIIGSVKLPENSTSCVVTYVSNNTQITTTVVEKGTTIHLLEALPNQGYNHFVGWRDQDGKNYEGGAKVENISKDMTFTAQWAYIPPANPNYKITIGDMENGTVTANPTAAKKGDTVTLTVTPEDGYELAELTVTDFWGKDVALTANGDGTYTFTMPSSQVEVKASFTQAEKPELPFTDVTQADWFYDEVKYVVDNGLMIGVSDTEFAPGANLTRAMMWTILARMDGETITGANWAQDARAWAMANGVSDGTDADRAVTREELVTMIWRYVGQPQGTGDLSSFADADTVSDWAQEAMSWSVGTGLIVGDENGLTPTATAIRAQIAAILMRFCENVAK